jgi:NTE family protein
MQTLREYLEVGPFALAMSSGFFGFFAHAGMLSVLEDEALVPSRVTGSSAGALVGATWASGVDAMGLADELLGLERSDFWDPGFGPGILRGRLFHERLERLLRAKTFDGCRVPFALSVFDVRTRTTHVLERGPLNAAVRASCAVPLLFHPVRIEGRSYLDGGILDRPGLHGMPKAETRVLFHHLTSRSPWRNKLELPRRDGMVTLAIEDLPRSGPFRLDAGRRAFHVAREATRRALDRVVPAEAYMNVPA